MSPTYVYSTKLTVMDCGACHIPFAIPEDLYSARRNDGQSFYCPNGHFIHYFETENGRLRRQLKAERDRLTVIQAERDQAEASRRAWKGQATKLRNRAVVGECPFCGQHLRDLSRHLARIHPDEAAKDPEAEPVP